MNAEGHREVLGFDVITTEDGARWLAFLRGLVARGLSGTALVISRVTTDDDLDATREARTLESQVRRAFEDG